MQSQHDFRIELLLCIPVVWLLLQLLPDTIKDLFRGGADIDEKWEMSSIEVLPDQLAQKEVLMGLFNLEKIPVNLADAELLATVPGIGPALADRIIEERNRSGFFQYPADLVKVHGIGTRRAEQFQSYLRFD